MCVCAGCIFVLSNFIREGLERRSDLSIMLDLAVQETSIRNTLFEINIEDSGDVDGLLEGAKREPVVGD